MCDAFAEKVHESEFVLSIAVALACSSGVPPCSGGIVFFDRSPMELARGEGFAELVAGVQIAEHERFEAKQVESYWHTAEDEAWASVDQRHRDFAHPEHPLGDRRDNKTSGSCRFAATALGVVR